MKEKNVEDHRAEQNQRQRDELAGKQKHPSHDLHQEDEVHADSATRRARPCIGRQGQGASACAGSLETR